MKNSWKDYLNKICKKMKIPHELKELSKRDLIRLFLAEREELKKRIEELERRLAFYENPHTPPSKDGRKNKQRNNFESKTGLPVGKRRGHKGRTREKKKPTGFLNSFQNICTKCRKRNKPKKIKEKIYEEIPEPQPIKVIKARWGYYECDCGHCWESRHPDVPEKGIIGKNAQTHITILKFDDRLPLRKAVAALKRQFDFDLTSKAVYDVTKRVAGKINPKYKEIRKKIRRAKSLHIDETKIKIQGAWYYIWIFRSRKYVFFVIRKERNKKVLDEILGYNYRGIIICDGLSAYREYTKYLQRCWAHILRETRELAKKYDNAKLMHKWMKDLFEKVKSVTTRDPIEKRQKLYDKCRMEMTRLIEIYSSYKHLSKVVTTIRNGLEFWFTRIIHPSIEPTNNNAEQPLREIKVIHKIIGTLRNRDGADIMERIMTLLATWRIQQKNTFKELRAII